MEAFILSPLTKGATIGGVAYFAINDNALERFSQDTKSAAFDVASRMITSALVALPIQFAYDLLPLPVLLTRNKMEVAAILLYLAYMYPVTYTIILPVERFVRSAFAEIE